MAAVIPICRLEEIANPEDLLRAAAKARRGKSRRPDVEAWWLRRETEVLRLAEQLQHGRWRPSPYHFFEIHEPKRRMIAAAPFEDRVVHHALCASLQPLLERRFIARSFSCQIGKGTTAARDCCRQLTNRYRFVLKCDVKKFFPSLDHDVLLGKLAAVIRDPAVLALCKLIVASFHTPDRPRPCGVPIGNLTSQLWGNFYLDRFDHVITEGERHGAYLRYTDDFLLFSDDKRRLWELRARVVSELAAMRLELSEPKSRLLATKEGVPFCGFRFLPGLQPRVLGATKRRFENRRGRLSRAGEMIALTKAVFAWYQFSKEANAAGLRAAYSTWALHPSRRRSRPSRNPKFFPASRKG
jgi:hypothetical protein